MRSRLSFGRIAATTLEVLAWVGLASALVALLDSVAEPAGLGSLYLIAVLAVAIRLLFDLVLTPSELYSIVPTRGA